MNSRKSREKKHKLIRKGHGEEPTVIEFNLSKAVILLIIIGAIIVGIVTKEIVTTIKEAKQTELLANEEQIDVQDIKEVNGDLGYITSAEASEVKTGVGPFDDNDDPGNDSSEENNIVRSFDQITWTYELTFGLKPGTTETNLKGGVIEVEAKLPESLTNLVEWDLGSMLWIEDANLSSDGMNLTGNYIMSDEEITIPGKTNVVFVLQVKNATQGTKIQPTFTVKLAGNEETEEITKTAEEVIVSSTGKYNIQLVRNTYLEDKTTVDYGQGETAGRMYGYGFTVQLYNDNESKGLKGLEYPQGEISFDIDLKLERTEPGSIDKEDITKEATPILWNYRVNNWDTNNLSGNIKDREMYYSGNIYSVFSMSLPLGIDVGERYYSTYNSGDIKIEQSGSKLHVTINDYDFDKEFPMYSSAWPGATINNRGKYEDCIGTFSVGYMQIFVPDTEESTVEGKNYYLTVSDSNMTVTSSTQEIKNIQMNILDDSVSIQHVINRIGYYSQLLYIFDKNFIFGSVESNYGTGDGKINIGDIITINTGFQLGVTNDYDIYTANRFVKFDGKAFEPIYYDDGRKYTTSGMYENVEFKVWYVTKADGTNWTSQEEMNNGNIEDMKIYENIEDIPKDKICVGIYVETISGYLSKISGTNNMINFLLKIKDTAEIGKTYGITQRTWYWIEKLDRSIYTITNLNVEWPEVEWDSGNLPYIKTEYDENGQIVVGTHSGGFSYGNTVLIVGANLHGNIRAIDSNKADKVNYDLGKNEDIVTYSIEPALDANENIASQIEDVVIKAEVKLPQGLEYVLGSSKRGEESYNEPEIKENENGSTTLVWYIYGVTSGQEIEPILFNASIDKSSNNGTQYETTFIISEHVPESETAKIGNSEVKNRTSTESINIINLASFRLYKEVETPVIEKNGEIHFTITARNSNETTLPEFAILDIMPYNEDGRGTKYNGTYTISKITISQNINGTPVENNELKLYVTKETTKSGQAQQYEEIKNITVKDKDLGTSEIWEEMQGTNGEYTVNKEQANDGITAIAVKGELVGQAEIVVEIYMTTNENQAEDKYVNSATAQTEILTEVVQTSQESAQVIERAIDGKVWQDTNYNSIIDNNENLGEIDPEKVILKLYKVNEDDSLVEAVNVDGNPIQTIHPDEKGYYEFSGLPAGNYVVEVQYDGEEYKLVEKEAISNIEVTSKFEQQEQGKGQTELITKLNSSSNLKLEENNVNAGLSKKINLEFIKVAEENHENTIGGTEFKLYKLECTEHSEGYHDNEQIDTSNVNSCWELVGTEESSTNKEGEGKVSFKDLQLDEEYRLVETKATLNRIKPDGQWKIEFVYMADGEGSENNENNGNNENSESTSNNQDITINGNVEVQITAIGNPPGFIKENEELLLPNRAYFEFPTSGSIGSKTIYQIGIVIFTLGMIILISRKYIVRKKYKNKK